jgi:hypothetical protein
MPDRVEEIDRCFDEVLALYRKWVAIGNDNSHQCDIIRARIWLALGKLYDSGEHAGSSNPYC